MRVHTYENVFLGIGGGLLVLCLGALLYASVALGVHLPEYSAPIDPQQVYSTAPFDQPGVREVAPGRYEAVIVASAWAFNPAEIRVPVGAEVRFTSTATDVLHGIHVEGTRINMMLIPGQVTHTTYTFQEPGEHLVICHEYCGLGHHFMYGKVIVE